MADITEIATAHSRVGCPYLSGGHSLDKYGFTMNLPHKSYLSCDPVNIDQEKDLLAVYCYDLAERVYNDTQDVALFGVYAETGAYADDITTAKHMYAMDVFFKLTHDYQVAVGGERNADIRAARVQCRADGSLDGVMHGMYLCTIMTGGETYLGKYLEYTSSYGIIGLEIRTESRGSGAVTLGDGTSYGACGLFIAGKATVAWTGTYHGIAIHLPLETGAITTTAGIAFVNSAIWTGTAFDTGIDLGDSMCTTAIDIGTITTGIAFTGNISTCAITFGLDGTTYTCPKFLKIGDWGDDVQWDGADEFIEILVETTKVDVSKGMIKFRLEGDNDADMTVGNLITLQVHTYGASTYDVYSMCGIQVNMGIKGASAQLTGGTIQGIEVKLEDLENDLTQAAGAIAVNVDIWQSFNAGTTMGGDLYWFRLYKSGSLTTTYADAIFRFQDQSGGGIATNLFSFNRTIASNCNPFASGDLSTTAGADVDCDGYITIDLGGTPYYIPIFDTKKNGA